MSLYLLLALTQAAWTTELQPPDSSELKDVYNRSGIPAIYSTPAFSIRVANEEVATEWRKLWLVLPPPSVVQDEGSRVEELFTSVSYDGETGRCFRRWEAPIRSDVMITIGSSPEASSRRMREGWANAAGYSRRIEHTGLYLGDEAFTSVESPGSVQFRVGRVVVSTSAANPDLKLPLAYATHFRIYATGVLFGDRARQFIISNGTELRGLATEFGYVSLKELQRVFTHSIAEIGPKKDTVILHWSGRKVQFWPYEAVCLTEGRRRACPPPVPYDGDLWLPIRAAIEELGLQVVDYATNL